jgi:uncharacterized membrane protein
MKTGPIAAVESTNRNRSRCSARKFHASFITVLGPTLGRCYRLPVKRKAKKGAKKKAKRTVKKKPKMKIKAWEAEKKAPSPAPETQGIKAWATAEAAPAQAQPPTSTPAETQPATEGSQPSSSEM